MLSFVTHDIAEAYRVCDNIIVYENGVSLENRERKTYLNILKVLQKLH